ncbi:hypothetical protein [Amycolatopsis orientalis]|uniref:hypothetical protein n=1 Tax=Amycolatopsis orientalis TaxID=31958 RepID=UPI001267E282|nr:hypothetical protein [Amycolatopsis orientalis]
MNPDLREIAAKDYQLPRLLKVESLAGYGSALAPTQYPSTRALEKLTSAGVAPVDIWTVVALKALGVPAVNDLDSWESRTSWLQENQEAVEVALSDADQEAGKTGTTKLFLFDALDRLHNNRRQADQLAGGILEFALNLRLTTRNLRAKVFIRHDMLESAQGNFPDASKLVSNAADLTWSQVSLYGLLFQHLGNADTSEAALFRQAEPGWRERNDRHVPPEPLVTDSTTQQKTFIRLAGRFMGTNHRKGHTYTWLPNHLADGNGQTSPRSFLVALRTAAERTGSTYSTHEFALHWDAIKRGVQVASQTRVSEIQEDIRWIKTAIDPLQGLQVPIEQSDVIARWTEVKLSEMLANFAEQPDDEDDARTGPANPNSYPKLITELIDLGLMTRRANGKLDLPDVYRIAFDLGRKGGVPRVRT